MSTGEENIRHALALAMDQREAAALEPSGVADFLELMRTITEVVEFTSRLSQRAKLERTVNLTIEMNNVRGRVLTSLDPLRHWWDITAPTEPVLGKEWHLKIEEVVAKSADLALGMMSWFYERFNKPGLNMEMIRQDQQRFMRGR